MMLSLLWRKISLNLFLYRVSRQTEIKLRKFGTTKILQQYLFWIILYNFTYLDSTGNSEQFLQLWNMLNKYLFFAFSVNTVIKNHEFVTPNKG